MPKRGSAKKKKQVETKPNKQAKPTKVAEDDEEIDEDMAFDEKDEERYGHLFTSRTGGDNEDQSEGGDDNEGGATKSLSDMLDEPQETSVPQKKSKQTSKPVVTPATKKQSQPLTQKQELNEDENEDNDDDDEEEGDEEEGGIEGDDEEEEEGGEIDPEAHDMLLKALGSLDSNTKLSNNKKTANASKKLPPHAKGTELLDETEFFASSNSGEGGGGLNMQDLMGSLANLKNADLKKLKNRLMKLRNEKKTQPVEVPLEEVRQNEVERKVTYEAVKQDISQWTSVITRNRLAKTLEFPLNEPRTENVSSASLQTHFKPSNNLENDLQNILETYGYTEKAMRKREKEQLEQRELTPQEVKEKQQHLAQLKSLLFYHEIKQKRLKKIKSKQYRKLKKKREEGKKLSPEELARLNPGAAQEMQMNQEAERIKERMTQRHKNNSKWAKKALEQMKTQRMGPNVKEARTAIEQQLAAHQKLTRKPDSQLQEQQQNAEEGSSSDDEDDDEDEEDGGDGAAKRYKAKIAALKTDDPDTSAVKGVAGLKFMQKGFERRRAETEKMLADALAEDNGETPKEDPIPEAKSRKKFNAAASLPSASPNLPEDGRIEMLSNGFQSSKVGFSKGFSVGTDKPVDTASKKTEKSQADNNLFEVEEFSDHEGEQKKVIEFKTPTISLPPPKSILKRKVPEVPDVKVLDSDESDTKNPWQTNERAAKTQAVKLDASNLQLLSGITKQSSSKFNLLNQDANTDASSIGGQERLVKEAFSITGEAEQMFNKEKAELIAADLPKFEDHAVPGWGHWGNSSSQPKPMSKMKLKIKAAIEKKAAEEAAGRQDAKLSHVIISQKTDKKSVKYMVPQLPYPFTSVEQFDKAQRTPIGTEWNTQNTFQETIKPSVITKPGVIIEPMARSNKSVKRKQASKAKAGA